MDGLAFERHGENTRGSVSYKVIYLLSTDSDLLSGHSKVNVSPQCGFSVVIYIVIRHFNVCSVS